MLDETESSIDIDNENTADASSWDERQLCPDGNCVGVIGSDGRCRECGLAADGNSVSARNEYEGSDGDPDAPDEAHAEGAALDSSFEEAEDLADRRLCPDGSCLGLLGEDNRCKICGQVGD